MRYKIMIKSGNLILEEDATFIVNASNTQLLLGDGVSMSFKRHCGHLLQEEMTKIKNEVGKFYKGDVVITSSGNAKNFKYTLHGIVMNYEPGTRGSDKLPSLDDIHDILNNIQRYCLWFNKNTNLKKIKLVLPFLGCGHGLLMKSSVFLLYKEFFSQEIDFNCDVVIYIPDSENNLEVYKGIL